MTSYLWVHFLCYIKRLVNICSKYKSKTYVFSFQASKDPLVVENIMTDLDENRDGEVDFQEFVVLVAALTVACNDFFVQCMKNWFLGHLEKIRYLIKMYCTDHVILVGFFCINIFTAWFSAQVRYFFMKVVLNASLPTKGRCNCRDSILIFGMNTFESI